MGERKEDDMYHNLSRKDLQVLCKKYGLLASKSNSEMATSLILYLEKKNLNSRAIWEGTRSDIFASGMRELQAGVKINSTDDQRKGSGNYQHHIHQDAQQNDLQKCKGSASPDKASEDEGKLTQLYRECNSGAAIQENTSVISSSAVVSSPTFTYDVYCEDGIQLCVDLNSSSSDWVDNLKAGLHVSRHVHKPISQSFHQDKGLQCCSTQKNGSVIMDPSEEADLGELEIDSYPTNVVADIQAPLAEPEGLNLLNRSLNNLGNPEEELTILSSKLVSGTHGELSGIEAFRKEETLAPGSGLNEVVQTEMFCDFQGNSVPFDPRCSGLPVHWGASPGYYLYEKSSLQQTNSSKDAVVKCELSTTVCMEMQKISSATLSHDIDYSPAIHRCADLIKQLKNGEVEKSVQTHVSDGLQKRPIIAVDRRKSVYSSPSIKNPLLDLPNINRSEVEPQQGLKSLGRTDGETREAQTHSAEYAGFPRTQEADGGTDEEQKKDAARPSSCSDGPFDLVVPKQNGGYYCNATELIEDSICRIPSADVEKLGTMDPGNGSEGLKAGGPKSNGDLKKKKRHYGIEGQGKLVNSDAKILRSLKQFVRDVHSKRRRSSRLFAK